MTEDIPKKIEKKKPKWLRVLEQQSWQAELLISGLAIVGAMQMPELIHQLTDFLLAFLPYELMGWMPYFSIWYLLIGVSALIVNFIIHFALRALWIGILGLVSVYPQGIKYRADLFGEDYMNKVVKQFPDVNAFSKKLDDACSSMFAATFQVFMMMISISLCITVAILLAYLLSLVLPVSNEVISIFILALIIVPIVLQIFLSSKNLRDKAWVQRIHFPLNKFLTRLMYNVFYEPSSYITLVVMTNTQKKRTLPLASIFYFIMLMAFAVPMLVNSNVLTFMQVRYHRMHNSPLFIYSSAYEDQRQGDARILNPTIPSFEVRGNQLELFVPSINRENKAYYALTPKWEDKEELSRDENRQLRRAYYLEGFERFHQFYLNDSLLTDFSTYYYTHPNRGEDGHKVLISSDSFRNGENLLRIEKAYYNEEGAPKEIYLRFNYEGKE